MKDVKKISTVSIAAVLSALVLFLVIFPMLNKIKQVNKNTQAQMVYLEQLYLRGQNIREIRDSFKQVEDESLVLSKIFNYQGNEVNFISALETIATNNNIKQNIDINNNDEEAEKDKLTNAKILTINLTLEGTFPQIMHYLDELQNMDFYFNINHINLYYPQAGMFENQTQTNKEFIRSESSPLISARLSGLTYWR